MLLNSIFCLCYLLQVPDFANFSSLLSLEDFNNDGKFNRKISIEDHDDATTLSKIVEGLQYQGRLLGNRLRDLSRYTDDHIAMISQALHSTRNEFIFVLELSESLKLAVNKLESQNQTQEVRISFLETETSTLLSACQNATQELEIEFSDLLDLCPENDLITSSVGSGSIEVTGGRQEEEGVDIYVKAADSLLLATRKIRIQAQQLMSVNRFLVTSVNDLKNKLEQAELTAETVIQDRKLSEERILKLERDLEELQNVCSKMKVMMQDKEDLLRDKEAELSSLQNALTAKDKGNSYYWSIYLEICFEHHIPFPDL